GGRPSDDRRPLARGRRGDAILLPAFRLLPTARAHRQRRTRHGRWTDPARAFRARSGVRASDHRATAGPGRRQQGAVLVELGRNPVAAGGGDLELVLVAIRSTDPALVPADLALGGGLPRASGQRDQPATAGRGSTCDGDLG